MKTLIGSSIAIRMDNISFSYENRTFFSARKKTWVLHKISFDLHHGEVLGIIGRNGVGKSTLLGLLAGILPPTSGIITHQNVVASLLSLQLGFIPHLNGRENALLSGMLLGITKHRMQSIMDDIHEYSGLGSFMERPIREYSSGMLARLGFSIANHADPDVLLIDEVLGVGDEDFRIKSSNSMKEKIKSNKTVVIVSHDLVSIQELCHRVIWIEQGKIMAVGKPNIIIEQYLAHHR